MNLFAWMLHALLVSLLVGAGALGLSRSLGAGRLPTRWVWMGALVLSVGLPIWGVVAPGVVGPGESALVESRLGSAFRGGSSATVGEGVDHELHAAPVLDWVRQAGRTLGVSILRGADRVSLGAGWERWIALGWISATLTLGMTILLAGYRMSRESTRWPRHQILGYRTRIAPRGGPFVLGLFRPEIVLPAWIRTLREEELRLVLCHEEEHVRAGDAILLAAALALALAIPWNVFLWWQVRELRRALEVDCDRRVLGRGVDAATYGRLLLAIAHGEGRRVGLAPALVGGRPELEGRIRALGPGSRKAAIPPVLASAVVAMGLAVLACEATPPTPPIASPPAAVTEAPAPAPTRGPAAAPAPTRGPSPAPAELPAPPEGPVFTPFEVAPELLNRAEVQAALRAAYPSDLRESGVGGIVAVHIHIDESGTVVDTGIARGSGLPRLDAAAQEVARIFAFSPALQAGAPVAVWVQIPIQFAPRAGDEPGR